MELTFKLINAWLFVGIVFTLAGLGRVFVSPLSFLILIPAYYLFLVLKKSGLEVLHASSKQKLLALILILIWLVHATGLLVPETGFDAVWYHLPLAKIYSSAHGLVYVGSYYQSLNPQFSDLVFLGGFNLLGELGAKLVAYLFSLTFVVLSWQIARQYLDKTWLLMLAISLSLFQVLAWQATSFYVDVAKGVWELAAVWAMVVYLELLKHNQPSAGRFFWLSSLCLGASLATKSFSLLLLPVFFIMLLLNKQTIKKSLLYLLNASFVAIPFYLRSFIYTQSAFYAINIHLQKLAEIGGDTSLINFLIDRILSLPYSLIELTLITRDYISPLVLILLPFVWWNLKHVFNQKPIQTLILFAIGQWLVWWFVPPTSTRYAIAGFAVLLIIFFSLTSSHLQKAKYLVVPVFLTIAIINSALLAPRIYVAFRNLNYVFSGQSKQEYIQTFYDGWIDVHLKKWHQLK